MMKALVCAAFLGAGLRPAVALAVPDSVYTDLSPEKCRTIEETDMGSVQECPGVAGYRLRVEDSDGRQSVDVGAPDGSRHALGFPRISGGGFNTLGAKAEWRGERKAGAFQPYALVIRVNVAEDPARPGRAVSYLTVTRLMPGPVCVTARVRTNVEARREADASFGKPCL